MTMYKDYAEATLHVYRVTPIDDWTDWLSEEQYLANLGFVPGSGGYYQAADLDKLLTSAGELGPHEVTKAFAFKAAFQLAWEGDISAGPYITSIPKGSTVLAWKQSNNGDCFVASYSELPSLEGEIIEGPITIKVPYLRNHG